MCDTQKTKNIEREGKEPLETKLGMPFDLFLLIEAAIGKKREREREENK